MQTSVTNNGAVFVRCHDDDDRAVRFDLSDFAKTFAIVGCIMNFSNGCVTATIAEKTLCYQCDNTGGACACKLLILYTESRNLDQRQNLQRRRLNSA